MLVSVGILAHNEERDIGNLISDFAKQSLLSNQEVRIEIHVVANGCVDNTVAVAQQSFAIEAFKPKHISTFVHNLVKAGKSNAWNEFIHTFASPVTDFVFLLDADIRIPEQSTLQLVLDKLAATKTASVAIDESVKDLS